MDDKKLECSLSDVTMSTENHKMVIRGCITKIGSPSTGAPCGTGGKLAVFTPESVAACADSFVGMPLDCTYPDGFFADGTEMFTNHGDTNIGYIRSVYVQADNLMAEMVVWKDKFPDESYMILNGMDALGFSVEWYATQTHEDDEHIFMDEFEGCGCAILWKNCAAFSDTFIESLAAAREKRSGSDMTNDEKQELIKEICASVQQTVQAGIDERMKSIEAAQEQLGKDVAAVKAAAEEAGKATDVVIGEVKASVEEIKAAQEAAKAAAEKAEAAQADADAEAAADDTEKQAAAGVPMEAETIPTPKAGQHVAENPILAAGDEQQKKLDEIAASAMPLKEKVKQITKIRFAAGH